MFVMALENVCELAIWSSDFENKINILIFIFRHCDLKLCETLYFDWIRSTSIGQKCKLFGSGWVYGDLKHLYILFNYMVASIWNFLRLNNIRTQLSLSMNGIDWKKTVIWIVCFFFNLICFENHWKHITGNTSSTKLLICIYLQSFFLQYFRLQH